MTMDICFDDRTSRAVSPEDSSKTVRARAAHLQALSFSKTHTRMSIALFETLASHSAEAGQVYPHEDDQRAA